MCPGTGPGVCSPVTGGSRLLLDDGEKRFALHTLLLFQLVQLLTQHVLVPLSQPEEERSCWVPASRTTSLSLPKALMGRNLLGLDGFGLKKPQFSSLLETSLNITTAEGTGCPTLLPSWKSAISEKVEYPPPFPPPMGLCLPSSAHGSVCTAPTLCSHLARAM